MSDDRAVRCTARLDEMQRTAEAAHPMCPGEWTKDESAAEVNDCNGVFAANCWEQETALHVAAWSPASVLRLVAGLREILDEHHKHEGYDDPITFCVACGGNPSHGSEWPCGTVRSVASALGVEEQQ